MSGVCGQLTCTNLCSGACWLLVERPCCSLAAYWVEDLRPSPESYQKSMGIQKMRDESPFNHFSDKTSLSLDFVTRERR